LILIFENSFEEKKEARKGLRKKTVRLVQLLKKLIV